VNETLVSGLLYLRNIDMGIVKLIIENNILFYVVFNRLLLTAHDNLDQLLTYLIRYRLPAFEAVFVLNLYIFTISCLLYSIL